MLCVLSICTYIIRLTIMNYFPFSLDTWINFGVYQHTVYTIMKLRYIIWKLTFNSVNTKYNRISIKQPSSTFLLGINSADRFVSRYMRRRFRKIHCISCIKEQLKQATKLKLCKNNRDSKLCKLHVRWRFFPNLRRTL